MFSNKKDVNSHQRCGGKEKQWAQGVRAHVTVNRCKIDLWARLSYQIIFRVSDHQDFVESKFIVCLVGSGKHSCQARSSQHSNYKPDLIVKDFTVTLLMFALEKKSVFSYAFKQLCLSSFVPTVGKSLEKSCQWRLLSTVTVQRYDKITCFIPGFSLSLKSPKRKHGFSEGLGDLQNELGSAGGDIGILSERDTGSGTTRNKPIRDVVSRTLSASSQLTP